MPKILFGLKLWSSDLDLFPEACKLVKSQQFDYIELSPVPDSDITPFLSFDIPFIIHMTPEKFGINIANPKKKDLNHKYITECLEWFNKLKAKYLIVHPGYGTLKNALDFLKNYTNPHILIENMPVIGIQNEKMIGSTVTEIQILQQERFGFCFDLNHAIKASSTLHKDYRDFLTEFRVLTPSVFHISDGLIKNEKDQHLNIGDGDYDWQFLMTFIKSFKSSYVTLEVPHLKNSLANDLLNLKKIHSIL